MPNPKSGKGPQGPDPMVMQAIQRIMQTQLSPLEEVIFQSWSQANQIEDPDNADMPFDYRGLYKQTGGKVFAPGELRRMVEGNSAISTLMDAQAAHEAASPIKALMDAQNSSQQIDLSGLSGMQQPGMGMGSSPDMGMGSDSGMGGAPADSSGTIDNLMG